MYEYVCVFMYNSLNIYLWPFWLQTSAALAISISARDRSCGSSASQPWQRTLTFGNGRTRGQNTIGKDIGMMARIQDGGIGMMARIMDGVMATHKCSQAVASLRLCRPQLRRHNRQSKCRKRRLQPPCGSIRFGGISPQCQDRGHSKERSRPKHLPNMCHLKSVYTSL